MKHFFACFEIQRSWATFVFAIPQIFQSQEDSFCFFFFFFEKTLLCLGSYLVLTQTYKDRKTMQAGCLHASYTDLHPQLVPLYIHATNHEIICHGLFSGLCNRKGWHKVKYRHPYGYRACWTITRRMYMAPGKRVCYSHLRSRRCSGILREGS
jgi:hypothetical protein